MTAFGMAVILVEKGNDYPVRTPRLILQNIIHSIHWKLAQVLFCTTCSSFWTTLITDSVICIISYLLGFGFYFFWPFSGFITAGFTWLIIELLNIFDKGCDCD